jgi:aryl-alcohol dehydrogenase-like predicted oxidoreductase
LATLDVIGFFFVAVSPLGKGFLTGKMDATTEFASDDFRTTSPRFSVEARAHNFALVELIGGIAARKNATPAQVALAWLLAQGPDIVPIPGTTKRHRLEENLASTQLQLDARDLADLDAAAAKVQIVGERYGEAGMRMIDR